MSHHTPQQKTTPDAAPTAHAPATPVRRRRWLAGVIGSVLTVVACNTVALWHLDGAASTKLVAGTITALAIVGGFYSFKLLARHLGTATAGAALSLIGLTLLGTWALVSPNCPDAGDLGRCTTGEVATWALVGALLPVAYILLIGVPIGVALLGTRTARKGTRRARTWLAARRETKTTGRP
jgi:uncharacterized membrane protein (DUF441 family)